jgi:hypothetical protein
VSAETVERKAHAYDLLVELLRGGVVVAMTETLDGGSVRVRAQRVLAGDGVGVGPVLSDAIEAAHRALEAS